MADNMGHMAGRAQGIKSESVGPMGLPSHKDPRSLLSTYIYDYFLKTRHPELAQELLKASDLGVQIKPRTKTSPGGRDVNGVNDGMDSEPKDDIAKKIEAMPVPDLGEQLSNNSFLQDWFFTFWDVWNASKNMANNPAGTAAQYLNSTQRIKGNPFIMNGAMNNRFMNRNMNPTLQQKAMNNMQFGRMGSQLGANQLGPPGSDNQRPVSPMNGENAPSPKRARVDGGFATPSMAGNPGAPGQMANGQGPHMPQNAMDPNNIAMMGQMAGFMGGDQDNKQQIPNPQGGALADYQMQLMLLEQQNKRRLLMARQEQEVVSQTGPPGATQQPTVMGAQGIPFGGPHAGIPSPRRAGQSPSPHDPLKRNSSQMSQSPRPDGIGVGTRGSPAPGMGFDPQNPQMPNPQFFPSHMKQMAPNGIIGAPGFQGANGQMKPQMGGAMQRPPGMPPNQFNPQMNAPFGQSPQQPPQNGNHPQASQQGNQQPNPMPPPSAPANANATGRTNPSSPALNPASATPSGKNSANKGNKKEGNKKEPLSKAKSQPKKPGATPSSEAQTPPPQTPTDPNPPPNPLSHPPNTMPGKNQQQAPNPQPQAATNGVQPHPAGQPQLDMNPASVQDPSMSDPNITGNMEQDFPFDLNTGDNVLEGFDFDSFLHVDGNNDAFSGLDGNFFGPADGIETNTADMQ